MTPVCLTNDELEEILSVVNKRGEYGAGRICRMLAENPCSITVNINQGCSVGNISDVVRTRINPLILDLGFYIACVMPPEIILNRYNQKTGQHYWSFYKHDKTSKAYFDQEAASNG